MKEALLHGIYEASRELSEDSLHTMPKTMHVWAMNALFSSHKHRLPLLSIILTNAIWHGPQGGGTIIDPNSNSGLNKFRLRVRVA